MAKQSFFVKNKVWVVAGLLLLGWFYWFQFRPMTTRKGCMNEVKEIAQRTKDFSPDMLNASYRFCLTRHGLKAEDLVNK